MDGAGPVQGRLQRLPRRTATSRRSAATPAPRPARMCRSNSARMAARWCTCAGVRSRAPDDAQLDADAVFAHRIAEADEFYGALQHEIADPDARLVQRQALAGMLWSKQYYQYDVQRWLEGDPLQPKPPAGRKHGRNADWRHLCNARHRVDARQVGVPVVRVVGPGVSCGRVRADRSRRLRSVNCCCW